MSTLQKIKLGTPPRGDDGETTRAGFVKFNANVDVFDRQSALVSAPPITASQTLSADHIGRRVSINIADGGTVKMRKASLCEADSVVWLINVGAKRVLLAPDDGSGDSLSISSIGAGEAVALDTDGVSAWRVLMRGRAATDDETVAGNLSVNQGLSVGGEISTTSPTAFRAVSGGYGAFLRNDGRTAYLLQTNKGDPYGQWNSYVPFSWGLADGKVVIDGSAAGCVIGSRPTFAGNVAWDYGNLRPPAMFGAAGGDQGDLNPNAYEVRLSVNVVCGSGGSLMATSACSVNMPSGVSGGVDAVARLRLVSGATILADGPEDFTTLVSAVDSGLGSRGKLVNMLAVSGLTFGKTYTLQLLVRKMQPVGPLYPRYMQIVGVTA
ncbi:hypothetical protein [Burkholderia multivorans]|uniref:phage tail fiber protein n=1 Tax=Burkholderia multivorans TaxID=87883 RepID=UPI000D019A21|nr:hypothetical protein [Burkholderia multivorans]